MKKPAPPTPPRPRKKPLTLERAFNAIGLSPARAAGGLPHGCSIHDCESPRWKKGGRVGVDGVPELCPMHYHRELRDSPDALEPGTVRGGGERKLVGFRPADDVRAALGKCHASMTKEFPGLSQGSVVEMAVIAFLQERGYLRKDYLEK